jgi:hypothetical protein
MFSVSFPFVTVRSAFAENRKYSNKRTFLTSVPIGYFDDLSFERTSATSSSSSGACSTESCRLFNSCVMATGFRSSSFFSSSSSSFFASSFLDGAVLSVFLLKNDEMDGDFEGIVAAGFCAAGVFTLGWAMVSLIAEYSTPYVSKRRVVVVFLEKCRGDEDLPPTNACLRWFYVVMVLRI